MKKEATHAYAVYWLMVKILTKNLFRLRLPFLKHQYQAHNKDYQVEHAQGFLPKCEGVEVELSYQCQTNRKSEYGENNIESQFSLHNSVISWLMQICKVYELIAGQWKQRFKQRKTPRKRAT